MLAELMRDVEFLSSELGERHDGSVQHHQCLALAADEIERRLAKTGWRTQREPFVGDNGRRVVNVQGERIGSRFPHEIVVIGAHYDSIRGGPGADDNATGVAALLALARDLDSSTHRTVRLVAFANEEHPHTRQRTMGSFVHARACRARGDRIVAMLSLECLGFHVARERGNARTDLTLFQRLLPIWTDGVFVVSNRKSKALAEAVATTLRRSAGIPVRRISAPGFLPLAKSSDHWSFWKHGYAAVMISDGAPLRYRHYHRKTDTADRLDPEALTTVTRGISSAVRSLAHAAR